MKPRHAVAAGLEVYMTIAYTPEWVAKVEELNADPRVNGILVDHSSTEDIGANIKPGIGLDRETARGEERLLHHPHVASTEHPVSVDVDDVGGQGDRAGRLCLNRSAPGHAHQAHGAETQKQPSIETRCRHVSGDKVGMSASRRVRTRRRTQRVRHLTLVPIVLRLVRTINLHADVIRLVL